MSDKDFVACLRKDVLEQNLTHYLRLVSKDMQHAEARGPNDFWLNMAALYQSLDESRKKAFLKMIRQIMVDTISNVCGILDGTTILKDYRDEFTLTYANLAEKINGDLQDYFLAAEEYKGR